MSRIKSVARVYKGSAGYATVGMEIVFAIVFSMFVGSWLDQRYGTDPWFTWAGFAFGLATAVHSVLRAMRMMRAATIREEAEEGNPAPLYESRSERAARRREEAAMRDNRVDEAEEEEKSS
jgi:F0F1-type ATP synthase assembly protein I